MPHLRERNAGSTADEYGLPPLLVRGAERVGDRGGGGHLAEIRSEPPRGEADSDIGRRCWVAGAPEVVGIQAADGVRQPVPPAEEVYRARLAPVRGQDLRVRSLVGPQLLVHPIDGR